MRTGERGGEARLRGRALEPLESTLAIAPLMLEVVSARNTMSGRGGITGV